MLSRVHAIKVGVEREGWRFVAFVRLVPVFPFNLLNYALGLTRLSVRTFALTSLLTMAPGALAYAYLGSAGWEVVSGGPALVQQGLLALTLLAAVALLPALIRHWRRPGRLTPHQVHTRLSQNAPPLVVDVRSPEEFAGELGHIDGAVLLPLPELEGRLSELAPHRGRPMVTV
jgi:VTT domain/Rhodanese-like domain